jgi:hypothetical protein
MRRRIGELVIVSDSLEWTIYTPWGAVRDCTLESACRQVLQDWTTLGTIDAFVRLVLGSGPTTT